MGIDRRYWKDGQGWELRKANEIECTMDDSGVYITIDRHIEKIVHKGIAGEIVQVRANLWTTDHTPIMSFIGRANNVRKHLIKFLGYTSQNTRKECNYISLEHASYIGWELHRAENDPNYVQD